jgi:Methyltransferase domain
VPVVAPETKELSQTWDGLRLGSKATEGSLGRTLGLVVTEPASLREGTYEGAAYRSFHARRYRFLVEVVGTMLRVPRARILVVGPSFETALLRNRFPEATVDTLGIFESGFSPRVGERHIDFDLNDAEEPARWPSVEPYAVVVAAEVIEHLYLPPSVVFPFFASCLSPSGRLVIQTPNGVALAKRLRMLAGRQPYMPLRPPRPDPGHIREYTLVELAKAGEEAGLRLERRWLRNYFQYPGATGWAYNRLCDLLPGGLRNGITLVLAPTRSV